MTRQNDPRPRSARKTNLRDHVLRSEVERPQRMPPFPQVGLGGGGRLQPARRHGDEARLAVGGERWVGDHRQHRQILRADLEPAPARGRDRFFWCPRR